MQRNEVIDKIGKTSFKEVCEIYGVTLEEGFELFTAVVNAFMTELASLMDDFFEETEEEEIIVM